MIANPQQLLSLGAAGVLIYGAARFIRAAFAAKPETPAPRESIRESKNLAPEPAPVDNPSQTNAAPPDEPAPEQPLPDLESKPNAEILDET